MTLCFTVVSSIYYFTLLGFLTSNAGKYVRMNCLRTIHMGFSMHGITVRQSNQIGHLRMLVIVVNLGSRFSASCLSIAASVILLCLHYVISGEEDCAHRLSDQHSRSFILCASWSIRDASFTCNLCTIHASSVFNHVNMLHVYVRLFFTFQFVVSSY